jgi:membrane associated rhomboid family serine protease
MGGRGAGTFLLEVTPLGWRLMGSYALGLLLLSLGSWWSDRQEPSGADATDLFERAMGAAEGLPLWHSLVLHPPLGPAAMNPEGPGFQFWQVVTAPFVFPPGSFGSLALAFLGFAFFAAGVERFLGTRRFLIFWLVSSLGAGLGGFVFGPLLQPEGVHFGCGPAVLATMIVYCMMTPEAIVSVALVIPVRLRWIAAGIAGWVLIKALAMTQPLGAGSAAGGYQVGGVVAGYLWFQFGEGFFERRRRKRRAGAILEMVLKDVDEAKDRNEPTFH